MLLRPLCQLEVFPGIDRQYVTQLLEGFLTNYTMDQALNMAMDHLLENPRPEVVDVDAIAAAAGGEGWRREVTVSRHSLLQIWCYHVQVFHVQLRLSPYC
jgi:hypothetical protein